MTFENVYLNECCMSDVTCLFEDCLNRHKLYAEKYGVKATLEIKENIDRCDRMKLLMRAVVGASPRAKKIPFAIELFDFIAKEGYNLFINGLLKKAVIEKLKEMRHEEGLFTAFAPETKEFVYLLTGIKC